MLPWNFSSFPWNCFFWVYFFKLWMFRLEVSMLCAFIAYKLLLIICFLSKWFEVLCGTKLYSSWRKRQPIIIWIFVMIIRLFVVHPTSTWRALDVDFLSLYFRAINFDFFRILYSLSFISWAQRELISSLWGKLLRSFASSITMTLGLYLVDKLLKIFFTCQTMV